MMTRSDDLLPNRRTLSKACAAFLCTCLALAGRAGAAPPDDVKSVDKKNADRLFELHLNDAAQYEFFRDASHRQKIELRRQPVYLWLNPTRSQGQTGAVFVWTWKGRPEVIASIFSHPEGGERVICHELHSLSTEVLQPVRNSANRWQPQAGLALRPIPDAPAPAESARQRKFQLGALTRDFSAHSVDYNSGTWELRLLSKELLRYESPEQGIMDGALFAFVTDAGTDPEVVLLIEARETSDGPQWQYAIARFSDFSLHVEYRKREVWTSIRGPENTVNNDARHLYRLYRDRIIGEVTEDTP
jgi:hypothetical protein